MSRREWKESRVHEGAAEIGVSIGDGSEIWPGCPSIITTGGQFETLIRARYEWNTPDGRLIVAVLQDGRLVVEKWEPHQ